MAYPAAEDGQAMLRRIPTLTRVCGTLAQIGTEVLVLQRFGRDEDITLDGVHYCLRRDASPHTAARPWTSIHTLLALARSWQPDIVHVNGLIFPAQVAQARVVLGRKTRIMVQHHGEVTRPGKLLFLQQTCLRAADAFIFNGSGNADPWRAANVIRAHQRVFEVVEGSCDFDMLPQEEARRMTGAIGSPLVLWVGRLHPRKDPLTALDGFAQALPQLPDAHFYMIYGDETLLPQIRARLAQSPDLVQRVHLIGKLAHEALPAWYSAADLFLTSSPAEGSNYALIESMSCGASPVCSDIPPHRFLAGEFGVRWRTGDPQACARACVQARQLADADNRQAVRVHFERHLSYPAIGEQLLHTYDRCISLNNEKAKT